MKIAVIDHVGNHGGGSRFINNLLPNIKRGFPDIRISFFGNTQSMMREGLRDIFQKAGIEVKNLSALHLASVAHQTIPSIGKAIRLIQLKYHDQLSILPPLLSGNLKKEIEKSIKGFDVVYFPWPYLLDFPSVDCPVVITLHDFNYKYFFGSPIFETYQIDLLERQIPIWLHKATPIVSSYFMKSEIAKFYPNYNKEVKVIHLAPLCGNEKIEKRVAIRLVSKLSLPSPYIIYPTNLCAHKNIATLVAAIHYLWRDGVEITLALTGPGTERISGRASLTGVEIGIEPSNILGLGYVTNIQMNALIMCASAVVTTSLYEAGNGPGIDAWALGVPVAMSDIPCFTEHIKYQNIRAELFDPHDPHEIALKILKILKNSKENDKVVKHCQNEIGKITWGSVAENYVEAFRAAIKE